MTPLREQLKNRPITTLNGSILSGATSIDVLDGSVFPSAGNFHLRIEDEILVCTARSSNTLTVVRGQEGTSAAAHADTTEVIQRMSTGTFQAWGKDNLALWGYSSLVPLGKIVADDGITPLTLTDFTWDNQGGATASDQHGTILQRHPTTGNTPEIRALYRTAPAAPYSYIMALRPTLPNGTTNGSFAAVGFRKSSNGKLIGFVLVTTTLNDSVLGVANYDDPNTRVLTIYGDNQFFVKAAALFLKIEDDNTNLKFYVGDGAAWILLHSVGRTSFLTGGPDQIWWGGSNSGNGSNEAMVRLVHWSRNS